MKKIWAFERFYTKEENIELLKGLLNTANALTSTPEGKAEFPNIVKEIEDRIEKAEDSWKMVYGGTNYYTFCGKVKKFLKEKDDEAIKALKAELGSVSYSPEVNEKFKKAHNDVKNLFRVVEGEASDTWKADNPQDEYTVTRVNEGVYKYLWATATARKK